MNKIDDKALKYFKDSLANWLEEEDERLAGAELARRFDFKNLVRMFCLAAEKYCDSPIEQQMLAAMVFCPMGYAGSCVDILTQGTPRTFSSAETVIVPQFKFGPYRADFAVIGADFNGNEFRVDVECDGHKFHTSKEQVARDRKRDRFFQARGWHVMRFTGSEIFEDASACADEVSMLATSIVENDMAATGLCNSGGFDWHLKRTGYAPTFVVGGHH